MNIETRKIELINWITQINNEELLYRLEKVKSERDNWFEFLPTDVQTEINESIAQADNGMLINHEKQVDKLEKLL
jgi:hypothetical protein